MRYRWVQEVSTVAGRNQTGSSRESHSLSWRVNFKPVLAPERLIDMPALVILLISQYVLPQLTCHLGSKCRVCIIRILNLYKLLYTIT